ncbi:MAG: glycoside hydrolase family protein [Asticcacaulis sp.]|uniref:glycoside hydrolase family protein n=1 Tax=Asticcacaulis sp. TaxID=1872648 RepID=UPI0039E508C9
MRARQKVSRAGVELIKSFEGLRTSAARLPDGRWTLGYGHTFSAREGARVTQEDADALLRFDLLPVVDAINNLVLTPLNQNQFDALVSFCFNIGVENFGQSTVLKRINEGKLSEAALAMDSWRSAEFNGQTYVLAPLIRRRAAEKDLFQTPDEISHQAAVLGRPVEDVTPITPAPSAPIASTSAPEASLINPYAAVPQRQVIDLGAGEPAHPTIDMQAAIARAQAELREENLRQEALKLEAQRQAEALAAARTAEEARIREAARLQEMQRLEAAKEAARLEAAREAARFEAARQEAIRQEAARQEAVRLEAAKLEQQRLEQWRLEQARLEAAREAERAEAARLETIRAEAIRQEQIRQEQVRAEQARLEAERLESEKAEAARLENERLEAERLEAEKVEAARQAAERAEKDRLAAEQARFEEERLENERLENERKAHEQKEAEQARLAKEQLAKEQLAREAANAQPVEDEAEKARKAEAAAALMRLYSPYGGGSLGRPLTPPPAAKSVTPPEPQPAPVPVVDAAPAAEFINHSVISPSPVENTPFELSARAEEVPAQAEPEPEPEDESSSVVDFNPVGSPSTMPPPVITALNPYARPIPAATLAAAETVVEVARPAAVDLSAEAPNLNWREQLQRPLPQDYQAPEAAAEAAEPEQPFLRAGPSSNFQTAAYEDDTETWMMNGDRIAVSAEEGEEEHETLWQMFIKTLWWIIISAIGLGCLGVATGAWWQATHDQTVIRNGMVDSYTFISIGTAALGILFVSISVWLIMKRLGGLKD